MASPEPLPEVFAAKAPEVTVASGEGLGGTKREEDSWPWLVPWWLEDWLLPERPTPLQSFGLAPLDSAWEEAELPP